MPPLRRRLSRRHRMLVASVLFISYSVLDAWSTKYTNDVITLNKDSDDLAPISPASLTTTGVKEADVSPIPVKETEEDAEEETGSKKAMKEHVDEDNEGEKKKQKDAGYVEEKKTEEDREKEVEEEYPTLRPVRECTSYAIEQFPRPLMGLYARRHGGLIIHVLVMVFTLIGLTIVCDDYFVSSLNRICEELKLAPDVAGATFMAAGSSAPELATVVVGVFCAKDDIGVSGVIGSAVFNIMFVISVCALCAGTVSHLNWWPLCRDCFFYALSILVMLCTIADKYVSWPESLFMLLMYVVYCVALRFDSTLERWVVSLPLPFKLPTREEQAALVTYKATGQPPPKGDEYADLEGQTKETTLDNAQYKPEAAYDNGAYNADPVPVWDPTRAWDSDPSQSWGDQSSAAPAAGWNAPQPQYPPHQVTVTSPPSQDGSTEVATAQIPAAPAYYKSKEYDPATVVDPLVKPVGAAWYKMCFWYIAFPIHWACRHTMPDSRGRWYPVTFIVSMLWISFYSYFMVWMITIIGFTLGIPDTLMGLTLVAAGVSVPDALSSLAVIKEGYGDMAVSNAVGSNVFDILVCLGLPWFIQTAIILPGSYVNVISKGIWYSTLSLFSTVIFLVLATHANGWKLDRKYGIVLMAWYLIFITIASLYELNFFGEIHPPGCEGVDY